jgi:hypothetical protein
MTYRVRNIVLTIVGAVLAAGLIGASVESALRARTSRAFPVPGRLVDIGGRRLQLDCRGAGAPTVVLESGLDTLGSLSWAAVHDELAASSRVCAYTRAAPASWCVPCMTSSTRCAARASCRNDLAPSFKPRETRRLNLGAWHQSRFKSRGELS